MLLEIHIFRKNSLQKSFKSSTKPSACPTKWMKTFSFSTSHKVSSSTVSVQKTPPKPTNPQTHNHQHQKAPQNKWSGSLWFIDTVPSLSLTTSLSEFSVLENCSDRNKTKKVSCCNVLFAKLKLFPIPDIKSSNKAYNNPISRANPHYSTVSLCCGNCHVSDDALIKEQGVKFTMQANMWL